MFKIYFKKSKKTYVLLAKIDKILKIGVIAVFINCGSDQLIEALVKPVFVNKC